MDFANNLQKLRKKENLSQESIAEKLHISRQAVSKWESGQSTPDIETCLKLCEVLHVTPNQLLGVSAEYENDTKIRNREKIIYIISSIFLMLICICGTVMLVCNLNGAVFEPTIHTIAIVMVCGALLTFIATVFCWGREYRKIRA